MPFTQVKGTVTTGITKDNLHPERTQYQVILFVVIFCSTWQLDVHTHLFFVFCFCWGTKKVQATLLAIPAFVAIAKKHVQNGNHAGHYCKGCPPASVNFSLETTHTHTETELEKRQAWKGSWESQSQKRFGRCRPGIRSLSMRNNWTVVDTLT